MRLDRNRIGLPVLLELRSLEQEQSAMKPLSSLDSLEGYLDALEIRALAPVCIIPPGIAGGSLITISC